MRRAVICFGRRFMIDTDGTMTILQHGRNCAHPPKFQRSPSSDKMSSFLTVCLLSGTTWSCTLLIDKGRLFAYDIQDLQNEARRVELPPTETSPLIDALMYSDGVAYLLTGL